MTSGTVASAHTDETRAELAAEPELELAVAHISLPADEVRVIDLIRPDGGELPGWSPGAHIDLQLGEVTRQYSLCGDPRDRRRWRVAILREPESRGGSRFAHDVLAAGDRIIARGPRNHFPLEPAPRYRFIAGGIGITPLIPMIEAAEAAGAEWTLDYGGRSRAAMAFADGLAERFGPRVRLHPRERSRLSEALADLLAAPRPDELVYCCGPLPLLTATEEACASWPAGTLHIEHFSPRETLVTDHDTAFEVELAQSGTILTVPADRPIMAVLRDAGIDVPASCEEGTCGTCETGVLAGEIDHRDSLLTSEEQAVNDVMFICVSRAAPGCARLLIDR